MVELWEGMDRSKMTTHSQTYCEERIKLMHLLIFCLHFLSKKYFWIAILRKYKTKENHMCPNLRLPPYHRLNLSPEPLKQHLYWSIEFHFQSIPQRMKRKTQPTKYGHHQSASNTTIPKASLSLLLQTGKQKTRQKASLHFFKKSECSEASIAP